MTRSLPEALDRFGLSRVSHSLVTMTQPSIRLTLTPLGEGEVPAAASSVGGCPDLPPGIPWPRWGDASLSFVAQVSLAELSRFEMASVLPSSGILSFFYDPEQQAWGYDPAHAGGWRALMTDAPHATLQRRGIPADVPEYARFPSCAVSFYEEKHTFPPLRSLAIEALLKDHEYGRYSDFLNAWVEEDGKPTHRILGQPDAIQGDMQLDCQLASNGLYLGDGSGYDHPRRKELEPGSSHWKLLLQLDSDDGANMMWGDVGRLYFWLHEAALKRRRFDEAWAILQCY